MMMPVDPPRIIFITSTNLACNPRCLKEIELALKLGCQPVVYAFDLSNWSRSIEQKIIKSLPAIEYHSLQAGRRPLLPWLFVSFAEKMARLFYKAGWQSDWIHAVSQNKRAHSLLMEFNKKQPQGNFIIAHNPGAFYPAWKLSRKTGIPYAIDIEDFHPGEYTVALERDLVTKVMRKTLPHASYVSFAAPLIQKATIDLLKDVTINDPVTINNVFSANDFILDEKSEMIDDRKLKLVWFSQNISFGRGLEEILPLLESFSSQINLTLIGNLDEQFKEVVLKKYSFITTQAPLSPELLHKELGHHDIGLAIESNKSDDNRKICLTNKIWSYLQAGLYIWASNTPAQHQFSQQFPAHTRVIDPDNKNDIATLIRKTLETLTELREGKKVRFSINEKINWEIESNSLVKRWKAILKQ